MATDILAHDVTVVLIGNINPAIFSPAWLRVNGLISQEDMEEAAVTVIHPQICDFKVAQFALRVQQNRFALSTSEEPFVTVADWIKVIFSEALPHTPLNQAGINYAAHFSAGTTQQRIALGRALAPLEPWGDWGRLLDTKAVEDTGGLRALDMMQTKVPGREKGFRHVRLEPSVRRDIVNTSVGVYMAVNDHFEVSKAEEAVTAETCTEWVFSNFDESIRTSKSIIADMQEFARKL